MQLSACLTKRSSRIAYVLDGRGGANAANPAIAIAADVSPVVPMPLSLPVENVNASLPRMGGAGGSETGGGVVGVGDGDDAVGSGGTDCEGWQRQRGQWQRGQAPSAEL